MEKPFQHSIGHIFDSIVIKLSQDACLRHCIDAVDGSEERSRAMMALLLYILKLNKMASNYDYCIMI
jgi:hypothetical protein